MGRRKKNRFQVDSDFNYQKDDRVSQNGWLILIFLKTNWRQKSWKWPARVTRHQHHPLPSFAKKIDRGQKQIHARLSLGESVRTNVRSGQGRVAGLIIECDAASQAHPTDWSELQSTSDGGGVDGNEFAKVCLCVCVCVCVSGQWNWSTDGHTIKRQIRIGNMDKWT